MLAVTPVPTPTPRAPGSAPEGATPEPAGTLDLPNPMESAEQACEAGSLPCRFGSWVTGSDQVGVWTEVLLGNPLKIFFIVVLGLVARFVLRRVIDRVADRIATGRAGLGRLDDRLPTATAILTTSPLLSARREQRARTMASVLKSLTTGVVAAVVILMVLDVLGLPIGPLLASAGILGVAVGFGAQTLVKDFLSGIFMIAEDQYGVGDVVDLGEASGVVEGVGLRVTRVRDVDGTVWYIRNGEVLRVGNRSQGWARAVLDIGVAYGEDVGRAQDLLLDVARSLQDDDHYGPLVLEDPEMWGIESVSADGVVVRLVVKTEPLQQWAVARELRRRIKDRFDAEGVAVAHPQGAVWVAGDGSGRPGRRGDDERAAGAAAVLTTGLAEGGDPAEPHPAEPDAAQKDPVPDRPGEGPTPPSGARPTQP